MRLSSTVSDDKLCHWTIDSAGREFCDVVHLAGARLCRQTALAAAAAGAAEMDPSSRFGVNEFTPLSFSIFWILDFADLGALKCAPVLAAVSAAAAVSAQIGRQSSRTTFPFIWCCVYMCCSVVVHQWNLSLSLPTWYCCAHN